MCLCCGKCKLPWRCKAWRAPECLWGAGSEHLPLHPPEHSNLSRNIVQQLKTSGSFIIYSLIKNRFPFSVIKMMMMPLLQATCRSCSALASSLPSQQPEGVSPCCWTADPPLTRDTSLTAYDLSKPSGMPGQAACRRKEKKRAVQDHVIGSAWLVMCMQWKKNNNKLLVSSICCVCWTCTCGDTHVCRQVHPVSYCWPCQSVPGFLVSNSRASAALSLRFFLLFRHILAAVQFYSFFLRSISKLFMDFTLLYAL